jgi:hypothetical protein
MLKKRLSASFAPHYFSNRDDKRPDRYVPLQKRTTACVARHFNISSHGRRSVNAPLLREFRLSPRGRGVSCDANGAFIDSIPLLKRTRESGCDVWMPRDAGELSADLGAHYGLPIDASSKAAGLNAIARALNAGDIAHAQLVTLHLQIPEMPPLEAVTSHPNLVGKFVRELQSSGLLQKVWESDEHPRWPAGAPESQGGQFAPKNAGELLADAEPESEEPVSDEDDQAEARDRAAWAADDAAGKEEDREREAEAAGQETPRMSRSRIEESVRAMQRRAYWKAEAAKDPMLRELDKLLYSDENMALMRRARAPIGEDGFPMELHHPEGDPDAPVEPMTRTDHRLGPNYRLNHPWLVRWAKRMTDIYADALNNAGNLGAFFEADDDVGWFYLYKIRNPNRPDEEIDLQIFGSVQVMRGKPDFAESDAVVRWSDDQTWVGLFIKGTLYAYFDIAAGWGIPGRYPDRSLTR